MSQSTFSVRMEENLKTQFEELCDSFGMNMNTAFNVFARAVVRERRIPFEISEGKNQITREGALAAFDAIRAKAIKDGVADMSLEEINTEISKVRRGE
ncbi:MAG: type II toxin-antitoxin system RelB/DinJ family antitoxin [Erysipelotrichaceae bacterium]|nr:type II toxin-antitoxin system RelB/DinJ family antitoxin [Erysipelotrichaceae bacterium]